METLSDQNIIDLAAMVDTHITLHPTSVGYLWSLVMPHIAFFTDEMKMDDLIEWVKTLPDDLRTGAMIVLDNIQDCEDNTGSSPPIKTIQNELVEYLLVEIIEFSLSSIKNTGSNIILPWDIQKGIADDPSLSSLFPAKQQQKKLFVNVISKDIWDLYESTMEFTMGFLLFTTLPIVKRDITINIGNKTLTTECILDNPCFKHKLPETKQDSTQNFSVVVAGKKYGFDAMDFMRGFSECASLLKINPYLYWTDLTQYKRDKDNNVISMPIVF